VRLVQIRVEDFDGIRSAVCIAPSNGVVRSLNSVRFIEKPKEMEQPIDRFFNIMTRRPFHDIRLRGFAQVVDCSQQPSRASKLRRYLFIDK
jgi:hypothetical protein